MSWIFPLRTLRRRGRHRNKRFFWWHHVQEYIWPSMGMRSYLRLQEIRLKRERGSEHRVSLGLAIGVFFGVFPIIGQILMATGLAYWLKASMLAAAIGTFVGVLWTYPIYAIWEYQVGTWVLGIDNPPPLPPLHTLFSVENFAENWELWYLPVLVGAIPIGMIAAIAVYVLVRLHIASYRKAKAALKAKRQKLRLKNKGET